jgi:hypothetical protein
MRARMPPWQYVIVRLPRETGLVEQALNLLSRTEAPIIVSDELCPFQVPSIGDVTGAPVRGRSCRPLRVGRHDLPAGIGVLLEQGWQSQ